LQYVDPDYLGGTTPFVHLIQTAYIIYVSNVHLPTHPSHCTISTLTTQVLENKRLTFTHL